MHRIMVFAPREGVRSNPVQQEYMLDNLCESLQQGLSGLGYLTDTIWNNYGGGTTSAYLIDVVISHSDPTDEPHKMIWAELRDIIERGAFKESHLLRGQIAKVFILNQLTGVYFDKTCQFG